MDHEVLGCFLRINALSLLLQVLSRLLLERLRRLWSSTFPAINGMMLVCRDSAQTSAKDKTRIAEKLKKADGKHRLLTPKRCEAGGYEVKRLGRVVSQPAGVRHAAVVAAA